MIKVTFKEVQEIIQDYEVCNAVFVFCAKCDPINEWWHRLSYNPHNSEFNYFDIRSENIKSIEHVKPSEL